MKGISPVEEAATYKVATLPADGGSRLEFRFTVPRARVIEKLRSMAGHSGPAWADPLFRGFLTVTQQCTKALRVRLFPQAPPQRPGILDAARWTVHKTEVQLPTQAHPP